MATHFPTNLHMVTRGRLLRQPEVSLGLKQTPLAYQSQDLASAQRRVRSLYRRSFRAIPFILMKFRWKGLSVEEARRRVKARFYQYPQAAGNVHLLDTAAFRGEIDLYEFYHQHSTQGQLQHFVRGSPDRLNFFDRIPRRLSVNEQAAEALPEKKTPHSAFLEKFFEKNIPM